MEKIKEITISLHCGSNLDIVKEQMDMLNELNKRGIKILKIYICKHHWLDNCVCRKPKPYMINKSINDYYLIRLPYGPKLMIIISEIIFENHHHRTF